jgi:nitrogen fixation NifU-like protein
LSSDVRELYQELILDHTKRPRNFGRLAAANRHAEGYNPICGDRLLLFVDVEGGKVRDIRFEGSGCAISTASASLMTEAVKGREVAEAEALFERVHGLVTGSRSADGGAPQLGKLVVLSGVRDYPARVKCASLAWHTLRAALRGEEGTVSTEE